MLQRKRDICRGVEPDSVSAAMALTCRWLAVWIAAIAIASSQSRAPPRPGSSSSTSPAALGSEPAQMRLIASTAATGLAPTAVSADSITASVPSSTALATSNTSARVGMLLVIIDSIIWVAVIATRLCFQARRIRDFCSAGSSGSPTSTPRSPRATMIASVASRMSSRLATASARSILATTWPAPPASRSSSRA